MNKDSNDYYFRMCLWIAIPTAVLAIVYQAAIAIEEHILQPTFKFWTWYLTNYGLLTVVLIFLSVLVYYGAWVHINSVDRITGVFETETKKREQITADLQKSEADLQRKLSSNSQRIGEQNDKLQQLSREVASLKEQNQNLETENERLKNPIAYSLKQKSKIQKENAENLKTLIHQTHWREMK